MIIQITIICLTGVVGFATILGLLIFRFPKKPESTRLHCILLSLLFGMILIHLTAAFFAPQPYSSIAQFLYFFALPFLIIYWNKNSPCTRKVEQGRQCQFSRCARSWHIADFRFKMKAWIIFLSTVIITSAVTLPTIWVYQHSQSEILYALLGAPLLVCITFAKFTWKVLGFESGALWFCSIWSLYFSAFYLPLLIWLKTQKKTYLALQAGVVISHFLIGLIIL